MLFVTYVVVSCVRSGDKYDRFFAKYVLCDDNDALSECDRPFDQENFKPVGGDSRLLRVGGIVRACSLWFLVLILRPFKPQDVDYIPL